MSPACMWCGKAFHLARKHGSERRFCSKECRAEFHRATRQWAESQITAGRVTVARLKKTRLQSVYALYGDKPAFPATQRPPRKPQPRCRACGRFSQSVTPAKGEDP